MNRLALCLLSILTPTACTYSTDLAPDVGLAAAMVVGGDVTVEFPEVGIFEGPLGPCTATLIAPRAILTAAHCVRYGTDLSETAAGGWFLYNNEQSERTVKRYVSLGSDSGPGDLAVAELDRAVSMDEGIWPRALAVDFPSDGNLYTTLVGYGCGDTKLSVRGEPYCDSDSDFSMKRSLRVAWWALADRKIKSEEIGQLVLTVNGDSGGPIFDPNGAILFTVSDTTCDSTVVPVQTCTETYGAVPPNRLRIVNAVGQLGVTF